MLNWRDVEGMTSDGECALLERLASAVTDGVIVEIGGWRGRSAVALAAGSMAGSRQAVYTIDPHQQHYAVAPQSSHQFLNVDRALWMQNVLRTGAAEVCYLINLPSYQARKGWTKSIGLLFIDGDHNPGPVMQDWRDWSPFVLVGGVVALHDEPELGVRAVIDMALASGEWAHEVTERYTCVLRRLK